MLSTPQHSQIDQNSALSGVFSDLCRDRGVLWCQFLPMHISLTVKLHDGSCWCKKWLKVFKDTDVYEATAAKLARAHVRHGCCLSCNNEGFSPARCTLGDGVHLPDKLC